MACRLTHKCICRADNSAHGIGAAIAEKWPPVSLDTSSLVGVRWNLVPLEVVGSAERRAGDFSSPAP